MKDVNNLMQNIGQKSLAEEQEQQRKSDEQAMLAVNALFEELLIIYPAYLPTLQKNGLDKANDTLNKTKKLWLKKFKEKKITPAKLRMGVKNAEDDPSSFFPSVGEFLAMCKPTDSALGIPTVEEAFQEACMNTRNPQPQHFSHVIVYEAARMVGFWGLARNPESKTMPIFKAKYERLREKLASGEEIVVLTNAIEDKSEEKQPLTEAEKEKNKQVAKEAIDKLMDLFK